MLLLTHDDNFLLSDDLFIHTLSNTFRTLYRNDYSLNDLPEFKNATRDDFSSVEPDDWLILSNAIVNWTGKVRGSFDFFKTELIEKIGGSFDVSRVELDRTDETDNMGMGYYGDSTPEGGLSMKDWEKPIESFHGFMYDNQLLDRIRYLSPTYRVSEYCLEGERGLLSNMSSPQSKIYSTVVNNFKDKGLINV